MVEKPQFIDLGSFKGVLMSNDNRLISYILSKHVDDKYEKSLHKSLCDAMPIDEDGEGFLCVIGRSITVPLSVCFSNISSNLHSHLVNYKRQI